MVRCGDVLGLLDVATAAEVGDGAGDLENAVVGAGGEAHAAHGHLECALSGRIERAEFADAAGRDVCIDETAAVLHGARGEYALSQLRRRDAAVPGAQFLIGHSVHFDVEIDAIQQGTADLAEVLLDLSARAAAPVQVTTAPGVQSWSAGLAVSGQAGSGRNTSRQKYRAVYSVQSAR